MPQAKQDTADSATTTVEPNDFMRLLNEEVGPGTPARRANIEAAVRTFAEQALRDTVVVSDDVIGTIKAMIAEIDDKLTKQINVILHNERFQQLEGAWRGLDHLVRNTETDTMLKIRVLNVSKKDLARSLKSYRGTLWDQSPLFKKVYEGGYGTLGGEPFGCLVGDYFFDHAAPDVELLGQISQIAAAAHAPFIAGAGPSVMGLNSWQELSNPKDIKNIFDAPDYAAWKSLRQSEDAKYVGLALPRFLARLPYGARTNPVEEFDFEEETGGGEHGKYTWANAAYAMAVNVNRSFKNYGWCTAIRGVESGGLVEGLPVHTFPSEDGGVDMKCPTEIAISDRREKELADMGFMPMLHRKGSDKGVFIGAQSLHSPKAYQGKGADDANASANLSARLPYLFASSRFAHYLKCMVRDKLGSFTDRADLERFLHNWIQNFVVPESSLANISDDERASTPLAGAEVVVEEIEGNPGYYTARFALRPHYQLEGVNVSMSLVSRLPSVRQAG